MKLSLRKKLYTYIEPTAWPHKGLSPINKFIIIIVILSVASVVLETEKRLLDKYLDVFYVLNIIFLAVFTIEYALRLWVISENSNYAGLSGRLRYIVSFPSLLDLAVIIPFYAGFIGSDVFVLRIMRVLRILTLAKLGRYSAALQLLARAVKSRRYELIVSSLISLAIILFSATLMYLVEGPAQPENFGSIPRALWWSIVTLTTIGYGDVYPITLLGKLLATVIAIAAVGLIALPTGILAGAFSDAFKKDKPD